jgi:Zn-dependent alcohol dehydrogenase
MRDPKLERPLVFGHEGVGVVTQVGRDVKHVSEGDHAIVTWVPRTPISGRLAAVDCGATYREEPLHGPVYTWGEDVLANAEYIVPIPKEHATAVSSIVGCAVLTGAGAVLNTARVRPGNSVAVFGAGGVGLCAIQMASLLGAYPVIAVDLKDEKLEFAKKFGATHGVNSSQVDPVEAIHEISGGGVDFAFDAIGVRATNEQILPATRGGGPGADNHGGMAVLIGIPGKEMTIDPGLFMYHQRQYRGSLGATYPEKDFPMFLRWHEEGKFPLDKLVTRRYQLDQVNEACDALEAGDILGRAIIEY